MGVLFPMACTYARQASTIRKSDGSRNWFLEHMLFMPAYTIYDSKAHFVVIDEKVQAKIQATFDNVCLERFLFEYIFE